MKNLSRVSGGLGLLEVVSARTQKSNQGEMRLRHWLVSSATHKFLPAAGLLPDKVINSL